MPDYTERYKFFVPAFLNRYNIIRQTIKMCFLPSEKLGKMCEIGVENTGKMCYDIIDDRKGG